MPMLYESIELSGAPQVIEEVEEMIRPAHPSPEDKKPVEETEIKKRSFLQHLWLWLKSPLNTSWKDTQ